MNYLPFLDNIIKDEFTHPFYIPKNSFFFISNSSFVIISLSNNSLSAFSSSYRIAFVLLKSLKELLDNDIIPLL